MGKPVEEFCGDHSRAFWLESEKDIGPCFRSLMFAAPFGLFLAWWGVGSFLLTRSRHRIVLQLYEIGALDLVRIFLCLLLTIEAPLLLVYVKAEKQPHEYVDAFCASGLQWIFLGLMVINSAIRAVKDANVMKVAALLSLLQKSLHLRSLLNSGKTDFGEEDFALRRDWMLSSFALTIVASFLFICLARNYRSLRNKAKLKQRRVVPGSQFVDNSLSQSLLFSATDRPLQDLQEEGEDDEKSSPEEYVGLFSQLTFSWLSELMKLGYSRQLQDADLFKIRKDDSSALLHERFAESLRSDRSVLRALYQSGVLSPFIWAAPLKFVYDTLLFTGPAMLLRAFIEFLQEESTGDWYRSRGTRLALAMFAVAAVQTFTLHVYFNLVFRAGMRVRTALVTAIFNKSLRLSLSARNAQSTGELNNLVSTDAQRMQDLFPYLHVVWSAPLQIALCTYFLWHEIRWAAVIALATIVFAMFVLTGSLATRMKSISKELMSSKDERVRRVTESLSTMKLLKLYGWETMYKDRVEAARDAELIMLRKYVTFNAATRILWTGTPIIVTLVTFGSFVALGGDLDAPTAFVSVTLLQLLRFPMAMLPTMFNGAIEANVSLKRIEKFLDSPELRYLTPAAPPSAPLSPGSRSSSRKSSFAEASSNNNIGQTSASSATINQAASLAAAATTRAQELQVTDGAMRHQLMSPYPTVTTKSIPALGVGGPALEMVNGTFYWDDVLEKNALKDCNLILKDGDVCIVTGEVGSGKTALLLAMLGELVPDRFSVPYVSLNGSVAYAPQVPWIRNATVRDNILFGEPFDENLYSQVIECCGLLADLKQFPNGDMTEIGEKGINLSGGQKARVSLARSVYSRSDILLLESCFEAVDEHVASLIWQKCFFGVLKQIPSKQGRKRTTIVVTHSTKPEAEQVDKVVIMSKGRIAVQGTPADLMGNELYRGLKSQAAASKTTNGTSATMKVDVTVKKEETASSSTVDATASSSVAAKPSVQPPLPTKLIQEEKATMRGIDWKVYRLYLTGLGGWKFFWILFVMNFLKMFADIATSRWLAHWSNDVEKDRDENHNLDYYLGYYALFSCTTLFLVSLVLLALYSASLKASRWYHAELLNSIMRAPMATFFDVTPAGRIVQRFTKDMNTLDQIMPTMLGAWMQTLFDVLATVTVVVLVNPMFLFPLPFLVIGYVLTQRYYVRTSKELKNLDSISLSPIFSHFGETLEGCVSVRAFKQVDRAIALNFIKLDRNLNAYYMSNSCNRWLAVRMEFVGNFLVLGASILTAARHGHVNPALAGMAVSYTLTVTQSLNWFVRMSSDFETSVVSVERIDEYAHSIPSEAPLDSPINPPPNSWPARGDIVFNSVFARYRNDLDDVLKGLTIRIPAGSHVGICGKTGCGKSTVFLVLLRIVEARSGAVEIDGVNLKTLGLRRLRESISIIPQDAVLFQTTLRYNLDPTGTKQDSELWRALEICELSDFVKNHLMTKAVTATSSSNSAAVPSPLDIIVAEGGADFSFGQRQLLCIARALLRDAKILLSDEASSGIDRITDQKIQAMILKEFASRTTITIAHRLETIMNSDLVAVMDDGQVVEFDDPSKLMTNVSSRFYRLANDMQQKQQQE